MCGIFLQCTSVHRSAGGEGVLGVLSSGPWFKLAPVVRRPPPLHHRCRHRATAAPPETPPPPSSLSWPGPITSRHPSTTQHVRPSPCSTLLSLLLLSNPSALVDAKANYRPLMAGCYLFVCFLPGSDLRADPFGFFFFCAKRRHSYVRRTRRLIMNL